MKNPLDTFLTVNAGRSWFFLNKREMTCVSEASKINSFPILTDATFRGFLAVRKLQKEGPPCFVSQ